jgi:hypothetical protein
LIAVARSDRFLTISPRPGFPGHFCLHSTFMLGAL